MIRRVGHVIDACCEVIACRLLLFSPSDMRDAAKITAAARVREAAFQRRSAPRRQSARDAMRAPRRQTASACSVDISFTPRRVTRRTS